LTVPLDITDPKIAKAYAHPLRIHILGMLDDRVASPSEIATELSAPLTHVSYHVRQLASLGLIKLVRTTPRRGAVEHHYTAQIRPKITDDAWGRTPEIVKKNLVTGWVEQVGAHVAAGAAGAGPRRRRRHASRGDLGPARGANSVAPASRGEESGLGCRRRVPRGRRGGLVMDATRRGNYESGSDYVLEYGELRFTFNERDFTERVEQAAVKLGFVPGPVEGAEREDLVDLAVNGRVT